MMHGINKYSASTKYNAITMYAAHLNRSTTPIKTFFALSSIHQHMLMRINTCYYENKSCTCGTCSDYNFQHWSSNITKYYTSLMYYL